MAYRYGQGKEGKTLYRVHFNAADKTTVSGRRKDSAGNIYNEMADGSIRRANPKPRFERMTQNGRVAVSGKAARRINIKARRELVRGEADYGN